MTTAIMSGTRQVGVKERSRLRATICGPWGVRFTIQLGMDPS